jgi:cytidyltransferase-like protein
MTSSKIVNFTDLIQIVKDLKESGKVVVLAHGCFDLLHLGHMRHLEHSKTLGDVLIVTVTPDQWVNKGPNRPVFSHVQRIEAIAKLECVDYVSLSQWAQGMSDIKALQPNIYTTGPDYKNRDKQLPEVAAEFDRMDEVARQCGVSIIYTEDETFSSSSLLNEFFSPFPDSTQAYLDNFKKRHSIDEVLDWLERMRPLCPLVIGEAIVDKYEFCDVIGKASKDPTLAVLVRWFESYAGASLAIANHLAGLCDEVRIVTQLGECERQLEFILSSLRYNITPAFLLRAEAPTTQIDRTVDTYTGTKLIEHYTMDDRPNTLEEAQQLQCAITSELEGCDLVLAADFGHGLFGDEVIQQLWSSRFYLSVNTQSNAGNLGYNSIGRWRRADYICLNRGEVNLETRQRYGDDKQKLRQVVNLVACPLFTMTRGKSGSLHYYAPGDSFEEVPNLATSVSDRVGAGDAVFAVTSVLAKLNAPLDILAFVGNVVGAEMVAQLGNKTTLTRDALDRHITALLK